MIGWFFKRVILFIREYWTALVPIVLVAYLLDAFSGWLIVRIINWALYGFVILDLFVVFASQRHILNMWGGRPGDLAALVALNRNSPSGIAIDVAVTMMNLGLLMTLTALIFGRGWLSLGLLTFAIGLSFAFRLFAPPFLLFLAKSSEHSQKLATQLAESLSPYRTINLLTLPGDDLAGKGVVLASALRADDEESWRKSVEALMRLSRLLALDSRGSTVPLREEARMILGSDFIQKAIFISDENGRCEILRSLVSQRSVLPDTRIFVMSESRFLSTIDRLKTNPRTPLSTLFFLNSQAIEETL